MSTQSISRVSLAAAALVALLCAGCGGGPSKQASGAIKVNERDFRIAAPRRLAAGAVTLDVTNHGPDAHELIVVRRRSDHLPLRRDGLTVNEDRLAAENVGSLERADPGARELKLHLEPGT